MKRDRVEITKRRDETHSEFEARVAYLDAIMREAGEPLVTPEAERHAEYRDGFVRHVETNTLAHTKRNMTVSQMELLHIRGGITLDQLRAAEEIEAIIAVIAGDVGFRSAHLKMRVDQSAGFVDPATEGLAIVRAEMAYTEWRKKLPMPKRLVIDMLVLPQPLQATARSYRIGWIKARNRLSNALDEWPRVKEKVWGSVDEDSVISAMFRLYGAAR